MKRIRQTLACAAVTIAALGVVACSVSGQQSASSPRAGTYLGYTAASSAIERGRERQFRDAVSKERLADFHAAVTARPHLSGTPGAAAVADYVASTLRDAGLDVEVLEYRAYLSLPKRIAIDLIAPISQSLGVVEPPSDLDPDTKNPDLLPGFVAYSASGDVSGPIVYVNYGLPGDYAELKARGIDVRGKLAIARYGRSHRAVKVHTAEQAGALGLLIYSDPADDGFARGETWPQGYWRTENLLQRGNAKYSWFWHGDPLTPGAGAVDGAERLDPKSAPTLPRIPVAVLAWGEARRILERLDGAAAPPAFQGGLPFTYRIGTESVRVHLHVEMDDALRPIRDIVARVPGADLGDRGVLLGTHHDAWTFGGVDPGTGTAALLELARGLGALRQSGWRPRRTISLAFWDAEEFGLVGSTEYAEQRRQELQAGTICYVNTDLYTNGRLDAGGVPSLRDLLIEVVRDIPEGSSTLYDAWRSSEWTRQPADRRQRGPGDFEVDLKALGSGADFVAFQDHLGLPTLSIEFNATGGYTYGAYHSNYDTRRFAERVADPGFVRGAQLVRVLGTLALRLNEADVLPFRFSHYARKLAQFVAEVPAWARDDNGRVLVAIDVAPLEAVVGRIAVAAADLERRIDDGLSAGRLPSATTARLNDVLARLEQRLLDDSEPADRGWYRHVVYGWDIYSLYDGQPFPRLAEAIRLRDETRARREVARIGAALERLHDGLQQARALAEPQR